MRPSTLLASTLLLLAILAAAWRESTRLTPVVLRPSLTGEIEYCQTCHSDLPEISPSHPIQVFGCTLCHGGEGQALDADLAHSTMRGGRNPSDLAVVEASCGGSDCHSGQSQQQRDHIQRVHTSLQATYAGAIASIRYTFGAQPDLTARQGIYPVEAASAGPAEGEGNGEVDDHLGLSAFDRQQESSPPMLAFSGNCLNCHLSAPALPGAETARLTGCAACHTPTANTDLGGPLHTLTTAIPYTQCNTCHNRGNYDLRDMQFHPREDRPVDRLHDYYQPVAQFVRCEWTLDCVDCHTRQEAMGDGHLYDNQKEAQYVTCSTCHGTLEELPITRTITDPDDLALKMAFLNPVIDLQPGDTILVTEKGEPLWNTRQLEGGTYEMFAKASGQRFTFRSVIGTGCLQQPDQQESRDCHACHAAQR